VLYFIRRIAVASPKGFAALLLGMMMFLAPILFDLAIAPLPRIAEVNPYPRIISPMFCGKIDGWLAFFALSEGYRYAERGIMSAGLMIAALGCWGVWRGMRRRQTLILASEGKTQTE